MRVIGFNGGYGVGKSTAIRALMQQSDTPTTLVKFAQPLYDIQEYIYGRVEDVYSRPADFVKDRKLLQWLGTDWGRTVIGGHVWVDLWKAEAQAQLARTVNRNGIVVCDDVRFDNEAHAIHALGGVVVRITRPDASQHAIGGTGIVNHASEQGINKDLVDYTIENSGDLDKFKSSLSSLYQELAKRSE